MQNCLENKNFNLICVIVNFGLGSDVLKLSKQHGVTGGTIFLGKGTVKSAILELLELSESRKEIVLMAAEAAIEDTVLEELNKKLKFSKPNHGIAFTTSIKCIMGITSCGCKIDNESGGVENPMYNLIMAIVERGKAEAAIEAARDAGARGGTIIHARGSGIHETSKIFSIEIEPEKEIALIISESMLAEKIASSISDRLNINEPGNGVIFIQSINKVYGLY
ncbi:MAG TPA: P-II family nitrogen regulator [Bacillota bacterium]|jgi:nitrogen regulatory protein PII|nr:P-II family nitrogen regulator [Bacillota bacterium]HRS20808.1 P-II family nitrogen regulator [Clostridia bacterium]HQE65401.1 P-II family nitrogen regulator [Bacillota bacterium]HQI16592.1 P-II family nitrogen regulator [Bacillota bacterium]HQJ37607.1 P-II family nitrogen regulator [Bacillota bacterium]